MVVAAAAAVRHKLERALAGHAVCNGCVGYVGAKLPLDAGLLLHAVNLRIEDVKLAREILGRPERDDGCGTLTLVGDAPVLVVDASAEWCGHLDLTKRGSARIRGIHSRVAPTAGALLILCAISLYEAQRDAKPAIRKLVDIGNAAALTRAGVRQAQAGLDLLVACCNNAATKGQWVNQTVVNRPRQAGANQCGVVGLVNIGAADQLGRVDTEVRRATVASAALLTAVDKIAREVFTQSADLDVGRGATPRALSGHAGQAGQCLSDCGVRQLADVFGRDGLDDRVVISLDRDCVLDALADAGHDYRFEGLGLRCCLLGRCAASRDQQRAPKRHWADAEALTRARRARPALVLAHRHLCLLWFVWKTAWPRI
mmetsp:Transcript_41418/g.97062  ORF Transcript_41418/g.97062 Transcript_41418/m.97062 type:complete len:371 (+) Transcript_41418:2632-3744(+)